jgi:hypothetical protein
MKKVTIKSDKNGLKTILLPGNDRGRGFSIQTNGNLPLCHELKRGPVFLRDEHISEIESYVSHFGTYKQKLVFARFTVE